MRDRTLGSFDCDTAARALRLRLLEARRAKGLRQCDLGAKLGRPQAFVSNYEVGARRLEVGEFMAISQALGLNAGKLINELARA